DRGLQDSLNKELRQQVSEDLPAVTNAYSAGHFLVAVVLTFVINFVVGSFGTIAIPSLIIPYSGIVLAGIRAIVWGILFSPTAWPSTPASIARLGLTMLLLFLEGQGYVLAMLAALVQGKYFLSRTLLPDATLGQRYWYSLQHGLQLYPLVALQLAIAAV